MHIGDPSKGYISGFVIEDTINKLAMTRLCGKISKTQTAVLMDSLDLFKGVWSVNGSQC